MTLRIHAPAKLNLFLHVIGKRKDGYHLLQSIMGPLALADELSIEPADTLSLTIENSALPVAENLVMKAATLLQKKYRSTLGAKIILAKTIPVGAGLGGGSADAAAALHGLTSLWKLNIFEADMYALALSLGADVPVCYARQCSFVEGIGEKLTPLSLPALPVVLVNPRKPLSTQEVFAHRKGEFSKPIVLPATFKTITDFVDFLKSCRNDLEIAAMEIMPEISMMLSALQTTPECLLTRMSGSGATCFGIYPTMSDAWKASAILQSMLPQYFVKPTLFNG